MYQTPESDRQSKGMKVKHLVQLVTLTVLFTWLLYQLNTSHNVKIANLRLKVDDVADDGAGFDDINNVVDVDNDFDPLDVGDEILSVKLLPMRNIKPKELREIEREVNNDAVDELEQVGDEGDDSGEGEGGEDSVNPVDREDHVRNFQEIASEGELKVEGVVREGIVTEESESHEQPGQIHLPKSDPES